MNSDSKTENIPYRIFYMHIAKTAGSSLNHIFHETFGEEAKSHIEGQYLSRELFEKYRFSSGHIRFPVFKRHTGNLDFRTITFLRDPVDHLRSHLNWVRMQSIDPKHRPFIERNKDIQALSEGLRDIKIDDPESVRSFLRQNQHNPQCNILFDNCQTRYFIEIRRNRRVKFSDLINALNHMQQFDFVGLSERFDGSVRKLERVLDIKLNAATARENVSEYDREVKRQAYRDKLSGFLGYDVALYEAAKTRFLIT